jgi:hypothetical protein
VKVRISSFRILGILGLLSFLCFPAAAQESKGEQIARLKSGGFVSFKTTTEPASAQEYSFSGAEIDSNVVHRVLLDKSGAFYFGYDLEVEPLLESREFQVRVLPLSREFEEQLRARKNFKAKPFGPDSRLAPISKSSSIEILKDGDAVALDVLVNPDTHVKIVDLISVSYDYLSLRQEVLSSGPPRDYSLNDVELRMSNYRLLINGELVTSSRPTGGCAGPIIWFYIPGKGRFIFSMAPHEGYDFKKAGTIEHNKIVFNVGSDRYEWVSSSPVVGGGGNWNLWVLQDPNYVSEFLPSNDSPFETGSDSSPKNENDRRAAKSLKAAANAKAEGFTELPPIDTQNQKRSVASSAISKIGSAASAPHRLLLRLIFGAADRIENLLPKK